MKLLHLIIHWNFHLNLYIRLLRFVCELLINCVINRFIQEIPPTFVALSQYHPSNFVNLSYPYFILPLPPPVTEDADTLFNRLLLEVLVFLFLFRLKFHLCSDYHLG